MLEVLSEKRSQNNKYDVLQVEQFIHLTNLHFHAEGAGLFIPQSQQRNKHRIAMTIYRKDETIAFALLSVSGLKLFKSIFRNKQRHLVCEPLGGIVTYLYTLKVN